MREERLRTTALDNGVQRSGDGRGDCFIYASYPPLYMPPINSSFEQWRTVVIVTEHALFMTSQLTSSSCLQTNVLAKFVETTRILFYIGSSEQRKARGGVKVLRAMQTLQKNCYQLCLFLFRNDVYLKINNINYRKSFSSFPVRKLLQ